MNRFIRFSLIVLLSTWAVTASAEKSGTLKVAKKTPRWEQVQLAKITAGEAIAIAVKAVPGAVVELELEVDDGALVYEVVVVGLDHAMVELEIDAGTGEILEREDAD